MATIQWYIDSKGSLCDCPIHHSVPGCCLTIARGVTWLDSLPQLCYKIQEDRSIASSDDAPSVDTTHGAWWVHRVSVLGHREWVSIQGLLGSPGTTNNAPLTPAKIRDHRKIKQKNGKPER